jgi:2'-hydroxyisoflavone reductase
MSGDGMRILVLGGTRFIGRVFIEIALARGHELTYFHRGQTALGLFPQAQEVLGDRAGDLKLLGDQSWDAVLDTSGYVPRIVQESACYLASRVGQYIFISSISVFADFKQVGMAEDAPLGHLEEETIEEINDETYGPLKVLCEKTIQRSFPHNSLIIRPGLIVGPFDSTDRFTYWVRRGASGGEILAPAPPDQPIQIIDVRDLMGWTLEKIEAGTMGIFNATGPNAPLKMRQLLAECMARANHPVHLIWVDEQFLSDQDVQPWSDLPLWVPGDENTGLFTIDCSKAFSAGLVPRPLQETILASLDWDRARDPTVDLKAGLSSDRETQLITLWKQHPH